MAALKSNQNLLLVEHPSDDYAHVNHVVAVLSPTYEQQCNNHAS